MTARNFAGPWDWELQDCVSTPYRFEYLRELVAYTPRVAFLSNSCSALLCCLVIGDLTGLFGWHD